MSTLEIFATIFTVLSVLLAVFVKTSQYPIGIIGTILYFFVFWDAKLYASTALQVFFTAVQFYGWWYWLRGDSGKEPAITRITARTLVLWIGISTLISYLFALVLGKYTNANMATMDCEIFGLSVLAQFYLDRKKIETWAVWFLVNIVSIWVYNSQGLTFTTWLYVGLLVNTFVGYGMWKRELDNTTEYQIK